MDSIKLRFLLRYASAGEAKFTLDIDTQLPGSGITALFGESGSGKTTLLRCIAGLQQPDTGYLSVNGEVWQSADHQLPTHHRSIGYVFQEASLLAHLSVLGNLRYAQKRASPGAPLTTIDKVAEFLGLSDLLNKQPHELSGGERQRTAIARALLRNPALMLLDEPLAALDTIRKHEILPYLEKLRSEFNIPMLYVSHALDEVARLADHILVLGQGKLLASGPVAQTLSRLDLSLTAGDDAGAVIDATVSSRDERWQLVSAKFEGGEFWLQDTGETLGQTLRVRVLARDVSLTLTEDTATSIVNRFQAQVSEIVPASDSGLALVGLDVGSIKLVARLTQRSVAHLALVPGAIVWAQIKSAAVIR